MNSTKRDWITKRISRENNENKSERKYTQVTFIKNNLCTQGRARSVYAFIHGFHGISIHVHVSKCGMTSTVSSYLPDVLQRLAVHDAVEFWRRRIGPAVATPCISLSRVLPVLLVLQHLGVLDDGGGELGLRAGDGQTLSVDVLVDAVLFESQEKGQVGFEGL